MNGVRSLLARTKCCDSCICTSAAKLEERTNVVRLMYLPLHSVEPFGEQESCDPEYSYVFSWSFRSFFCFWFGELERVLDFPTPALSPPSPSHPSMQESLIKSQHHNPIFSELRVNREPTLEYFHEITEKLYVSMTVPFSPEPSVIVAISTIIHHS